MGLDLGIVYLVVVCACLFQLSIVSDDKNGFAIVLRVILSLGIPFTILVFLGAFGALLRWLS